MDKKYILIIISSIIIIFLLSFGITSLVTRDKPKKEDDKNLVNEKIDTVDNVDDKNVSEDEYKAINKNSSVATKLYEFIPKSYQTYINKMNPDYMLYEAISRLSKDANVETVTIGEFFGYKYSDVEKKYKEIYGEEASVPKKDSYISPIEYIKSSDAYCLYPYSLDRTDNMMVLKSVEENSEYYKVTVYSVCVYVDMASNSYDSVYVITKDTIKNFYASGNRNDAKIVSTYKKFELASNEFNPEEVVEKYESYLPQIEFYIKKMDERGTKYYIADIKDIY